MKALDVAIAFGSNRPVRPAIGGQAQTLAAVLRSFIEFRNQERAAKRRLQRGDQQAVVAARLVTGDRAERVSADAVGHQPLARFRVGQIAANFAAKIDHGKERRARNDRLGVSQEIMKPSRRFGPVKSCSLPAAESEALQMLAGCLTQGWTAKPCEVFAQRPEIDGLGKAGITAGFSDALQFLEGSQPGNSGNRHVREVPLLARPMNEREAVLISQVNIQKNNIRQEAPSQWLRNPLSESRKDASWPSASSHL